MKKIIACIILISAIAMFTGTIEAREKYLAAGKSVTYNFTDISIEITGKDNEYYVPVRVNASYDNRDDNIYQIINILVGSDRIKKAIITYKVNDSWIDNNNIARIKLFEYNKKNRYWEGVDAETIKYQGKTYLKYTTDKLSRSSAFEIIGLKEDSENITVNGNITEVDVTENNDDVNFTQRETKTKRSPGFEGLEYIIAIVILTFVKTRRKYK